MNNNIQKVMDSINASWKTGYDEGFIAGYKKAKEEAQNDNKSKERNRSDRSQQE